MRQNLVWRIGLSLCVFIAAGLFLVPAFMNFNAPTDPKTGKKVSSVPSFLPDSHINLGLDLRGGIQLTLGVDVDAALATSLGQTGQVLKHEAEGKGIMMTQPRMIPGEKLEFTLVASQRQGEMDELLASQFRELEIISSQAQANNSIRYILGISSASRGTLSDTIVEQAVTVIRSRIDQFGVAEPDIRRQQGENRISVQLPGLDDPKRAVDIIGQTAHLEFRMVRDDVDPNARVLPSNVVVMPMDERSGEGKDVRIALESQVAMTGEYITSASVGFNEAGAALVLVSFDRRGSDIFGQITRDNIGRRMAIILDGKVHSAPVIRDEIRGQASISGSFTPTQASDLALVLRAGSLPAPVNVLEERTVGPSLGQESIDMGVTAAMVGGIAVMVFMLLYYGMSGLIANVMLVLDIGLILAGMAVFGATLTLPGIAGIVLTLGMAVDANVLVFERIREEIRRGLTPLAAIDAGFSRAMIAIVDSNLTTIMAAVILYQFGTGPVRGFAVTLTLGIVASMFTAIFVSRIVFDCWMSKPGRKLSI